MRAVSDLDLERFLTDDLDGADRARVQDAAARDPVLAAHLAERRAAQRAFSLAHPRSLSPARTRRPSWFASAPPLLAAAACLALFVVVAPEPEGDGSLRSEGTDGVVARGTLPVVLWVRRGDVVFRHGPGVPLRPGDSVRVEVQSARDGIATVVAIDVRGRASALYDAVPVTRGTSVLPDSLRLDDAVGPESWIVVVGAAPARVDDIVQAWRSPDGLARRFGNGAIGVVEIDKEDAP